MTAPDPLLDSLWIPRQIVVDDQGTKLEVDAFRRSFSGDHDDRLIPEVVNEGRSHVSSLRTRDSVGALVVLQPFLINLFRLGIVVRAIEQDNFSLVSRNLLKD